MKAKQLAKIMKALSNENRLNLYMEIAKHEESDFRNPRVQCKRYCKNIQA